MKQSRMLSICIVLSVAAYLTGAAEPEKPAWLLGNAYKIPSQYTNQESGYFSIVEGHNGRLYIGTAKYGVDAYLIEFDPKTAEMKMVIDVHKVIGSDATRLRGSGEDSHAQQRRRQRQDLLSAPSRAIPEKGEKRSDYPGGYVLTYDPATGKSEHFGIAKAAARHHQRPARRGAGVAYISTCSDDRPIDHTHFMVLDLKNENLPRPRRDGTHVCLHRAG